jgi:DNA-binding MarR family transcriptional regulator
MARQPPGLPPYEKSIRDFLAARGTDLDAQAVVFNLDHTSLDVLSTLEGIALRPHELTHAGFVVLMTLWMTGARETRELAAALRVTKGAIVGAVDTLERRELVERERSSVDRRLVAVRLTDRGAELIARVQKDWHTLEREVTGGLTQREQRTLAALCRKVARSARRLRRERVNGMTATRLPEPERFMASTGR